MLINSLTKVDKFTKRVERIYEQKQADEDRQKRLEARLKEVTEPDEVTKMDFWCKRHGDTTGLAFKVIFKTKDLGYCAYYESFGSGFPKELMTCCKGLRRNITDKHWDNYYRDSLKLRKEARQARDSGWLLQPGDYGFITKYGDPNKKKYIQLEKEERAKYELQHP